MPYFLIFLKLVPMIIALVKLAEQVFTNPGSGADKKAYVTQTVQVVLDGLLGVSTGGQLETWTKLAPLISMVIDSAAGILFPSNKPSAPDAG